MRIISAAVLSSVLLLSTTPSGAAEQQAHAQREQAKTKTLSPVRIAADAVGLGLVPLTRAATAAQRKKQLADALLETRKLSVKEIVQKNWNWRFPLDSVPLGKGTYNGTAISPVFKQNVREDLITMLAQPRTEHLLPEPIMSDVEYAYNRKVLIEPQVGELDRGVATALKSKSERERRLMIDFLVQRKGYTELIQRPVAPPPISVPDKDAIHRSLVIRGKRLVEQTEQLATEVKALSKSAAEWTGWGAQEIKSQTELHAKKDYVKTADKLELAVIQRTPSPASHVVLRGVAWTIAGLASWDLILQGKEYFSDNDPRVIPTHRKILYKIEESAVPPMFLHRESQTAEEGQ